MTEREQEIIDFRFGFDKKGIKTKKTTIKEKNISIEELLNLELDFIGNITKIRPKLLKSKIIVNNQDDGYFSGYNELSELEKETVNSLIDRIILSPYSFYRASNDVISKEIENQVKQDINKFIELKEKANAIAENLRKDTCRGIERKRV